MNVTVIWAAPGVQDLIPVTLPPGATVADAVARSGVMERYALDASRVAYAVFGRRAAAGTTLVDGDRVEIMRPLVADPKEARRRRALAKPLPKGGRATRR